MSGELARVSYLDPVAARGRWPHRWMCRLRGHTWAPGLAVRVCSRCGARQIGFDPGGLRLG